MAQSREVCKICYNSTSHKPTPTLTFEPPKSSDSDGKKTCSVCRQEWAPIRVAKELGLGSSRWVRIRPRPKLQFYVDFMMCKNLNSRNECPRGHECSFAHSKAELWAWNQERQKEPRPAPQINGSYQYQLCKYILKQGNCPYGTKCTFAHNDEELQSWLKVQGTVGVAPSKTSSTSSGGSSGGSSGSGGGGGGWGSYYRCNVCQLKCNGKKQLEEHINSSRHRQVGGGGGGGGGNPGYSKQQQQQTGGTNIRHSSRQSSGQIRPRPMLSFQVAGYRLCVHVQNGRRCLYGDYCTFAHSQSELEQWNQRRRTPSSRVQTPIKSTANGEVEGNHGKGAAAGPNLPATVEPLQVKEEEQEEEEEEEEKEKNSENFSSVVRTELSREYKKRASVIGLESAREGVSISEVSGMDLSLAVSNTSPLQWVFEVTTERPQTLHSVVLFDSLGATFSIGEIVKSNLGGWESLPSLAADENGAGYHLNCKILPTDKIRVKLTMVPHSGVLGQLVIFDFGSFRMVRCVVVRMLSELDKNRLRESSTNKSKKPPNIDLYWENHYSKISMEDPFQEETDRNLPEYQLPKQIEDFINDGKYKNVESTVTKENYRKRMHNLLYLEEYQQRSDLSRYDLYDIEIKPERQYNTAMGGSNYAEEGYYFITVSVEEVLFEGGQSVGRGDTALLLPSNHKVMHECKVEHVGREEIVLKITEKAKQACASCRYRVSLRFVLGRVAMRSMHYAVDRLDLDTIFPVLQTTPPNSMLTSPDVQRCLEMLKDSELNKSQLQAITSMLDSTCLKIPSLVLGPFGCGKTLTLSECIKLLALHMPNSRVLICTHSNSAADIYVEKFHEYWRRLDGKTLSLFRLYYTGRRISTIPPAVKSYCKFGEKGELVQPSLAEMKEFKIVVATLNTARALTLMGLPKGHFTHIFIDEAAQALESESLIPLCLATSMTKIVLAGDHLQLDPPVYSDIARRYGLHVSLLERLYDLKAYDTGVGHLCKTLLTENHRSHHLILDLPSQLFYKNKLSCKATFPSSGPKDFPAVKFVHVEGQEQQEEDSPSFYNIYEAIKVVEQAQLMASGGLEPKDICVLSYYGKQVQKIRYLLREKKLGQVKVHRVEDVQGKEFRALIISTVRTSSSEPVSEKEAGFLTNPKMFNTAVTRARQWLVVVGDAVTLCTIGSNRLCWLECVRRCIGLRSFQYPQPFQFEGNLDYKMITRQVLEKAHPKFLKSSIILRVTAPKTVSTPTSEQRTSSLSSNQGPQVERGQHVASQGGTSKSQQQGKQRPVVQSSVPKITSTEQQVTEWGLSTGTTSSVPSGVTPFVPKATPLSHKVTSPPPKVVAANTHLSAVHNSNLKHPPSNLPPFLQNMSKSVNTHGEWCERMLAASYPLIISSQVNDNLQRQKSAVENLKKLVLQQIQLYREYMELRAQVPNASQLKDGSLVLLSQMDIPSELTIPANKQHNMEEAYFPTALPVNSHPLSTAIGGLNHTFTYNVDATSFHPMNLQHPSSQM